MSSSRLSAASCHDLHKRRKEEEEEEEEEEGEATCINAGRVETEEGLSVLFAWNASVLHETCVLFA